MSAVLILLIVLAAAAIIWLFYPGKKEKLKDGETPTIAKKSNIVTEAPVDQDCQIQCQTAEKPEECIIECTKIRRRKAFAVTDDT